MPHLKVEPFKTEELDRLIAEEEWLHFRAVPESAAPVELLGVEFEGEPFLLEIKKRPEATVLRADKISRPLDVGRIKRCLAALAEKAGWKILHSNIEESAQRPPLAAEAEKSIRDFESMRFPMEKVALEVGFGSGRHLLWQAERHPDTLFIGVEIHTPSAQQVLRQIRLRGLQNVWVVNYDARLLLEMLPSNLLEALYVHFPVPWDKKPHRRVISDAFVEEALRALRPGAVLELRTDSENYYRYALEVFSRPPKSDFRVEKNRDLPVVSKYEARWRRMEKNIYTLSLRALEASSPRQADFDFTFHEPVTYDSIRMVPSKPVVEENFFVHFGRAYRFSDDSGGILECSFGSFDRPEHKYLIYRDKEPLRYFPERPVATATNARAHQKIGAIVYGR
ncbi:tRNA (guanosine(46)-N7)-methyltransferase TrmB [Nitratifractor sp.]|uniref:tRNA (guanosine(46)-N7)-methyltransferase TrmB n=1 Tax=Nitratifractor sp. TaxID=2268144 RepID=UPI0025F1DAA8|nr:tRNA (guanosine(46)-N7)-methyltransferase TrmB [Nitratifractor sp.]